MASTVSWHFTYPALRGKKAVPTHIHAHTHTVIVMLFSSHALEHSVLVSQPSVIYQTMCCTERMAFMCKPLDLDFNESLLLEYTSVCLHWQVCSNEKASHIVLFWHLFIRTCFCCTKKVPGTHKPQKQD